VFDRLRTWARRLERETLVLYLAARDPRTPLIAKLLAALVAAYALSPIDLIPDFIPVIGLLDDLILVPLGIWGVLRLLPRDLAAQLRADAERRLAERPRSWTGAAFVVLLWLGALMLFA
jgi:uncharacterized membrane protein YkvA (DUF1232 family)